MKYLNDSELFISFIFNILKFIKNFFFNFNIISFIFDSFIFEKFPFEITIIFKYFVFIILCNSSNCSNILFISSENSFVKFEFRNSSVSKIFKDFIFLI